MLIRNRLLMSRSGCGVNRQIFGLRIRENCAACQSGEQHQSYVLYGRARGRRVAVYVPEELVAEVQRSLDNGRALQDLLQQAAPRYIKALKRARAKAAKSDED
jgi:hypothetical protein